MADIGIKIRATDEASGVFGKVAAEAGKLQSSVAAVGGSLAALGGAAAAGAAVISFAGKVKDAIDLADSFNKLSQKTGLAVEDLSKLNYAAGLADVSTEALATGLKKLNVNISAAASGSEQQAAVFKALGVSVKDASGNVLSADKVMASLADSFAASGDTANKAAVAVALFGKAGTDMIPLLNAGAKGLADMGDEAKKLGIVMGTEFAKNAEEFNDNLHKISLSGQGLFVSLAGDLVKGLAATTKAMADASLEGGKFAAVIAGIQTLLTGDDLHKSNVAFVHGYELVMAAESALAKARAANDTELIARREKLLALRKQELETTRIYRASLEGDAKKKEEDSKAKPTKDSAALKSAAAVLAKSNNASGVARESGNAFAGEQEAAKEWAKAYEAASKARDELIAKNLGLGKSEEDLKRYMESSAAAINEKTNPAMNAMVKAALEANIALESMGKLADAIEAQQKRTSTAEDETQKERERVAAIGLTTEAVAELNAARLEEMATAKERALLAADEIDLSGEYSAAIKGEVKTLRERAALVRTGAIKDSAVEAAKAASEEWKRGWEETDRLARDVFTSWATEGGNAAQKIGDALKKALLSAIYEATIKPIALQIYTTIAGQNPAGAIGSIVGGASGGTGSLSSLSGLSSLYGYGSKAMNWLGFGGSAISSAAPAITAASTASTGAVMGGLETGGAAGIGSGTTLGGAGAASGSSMAGFAGIPVVGWIAMGMMASGNAYDQGFRADKKGGVGYTVSDGGTFGPNGMINQFDHWAQSLGVDPKIAAILSGSALGQQAMYTVLGGYKVSSDGSAITGTIGGSGGSSLQRRDDFTQDHRGVFGIGSYTTHNSEYSAADTSTVGYIDGAVKIVNASVKQYAKALGLTADAVDGFTKQIDVSLSGLSAEDQKAAIDKAITGFMDDLVTSVYGTDLTSLQKSGETSSATLVRLGTNLALVNADLDLLGYSALKSSVASAAAASGLIDAAGGTEKLQASVAYYYEHFRSDSEKSAAAVANLSNAFDKLGVDTIPASKAAFDALLSSLDPLDAASAATAAGLLALAPAFDAVANNSLAAANKMLGALQDFGTSDEVRAFQVGMIKNALADGGLNYSTDQIANASRADFRAEYERLVASGNVRGADALLNQAKAFAAITQPKTTAQVVGAGSSSSGGGGGTPVQDAALSAWQDATDAIIATMKDLRNTLVESGPDAYAKLQAQFAIEIAQAKAGDLAAAQDLPALAKALVDAGKSFNTTSVAQALLTARVIDSLGQVVNASGAGGTLSIPHFAAGGYHVGGLALVGEQGPEVVNMGPGTVFTAADTRRMLSGGGGDDTALLDEIRLLRAEVAALRRSADSTAVSTRAARLVLESASNGGQPFSTKATT